MSLSDVLAHQAKHGPKVSPSKSVACEREDKLRDDILDWCKNKCWPRWKIIWARDDKKSTIPVGAPDLTIAAGQGRVFFMELKSGKEKQTTEQLAWQLELEKLGHKYFVIRSMEEFLEAVKIT